MSNVPTFIFGYLFFEDWVANTEHCKFLFGF